jgi:hypothetical protein
MGRIDEGEDVELRAWRFGSVLSIDEVLIGIPVEENSMIDVLGRNMLTSNSS